MKWVLWVSHVFLLLLFFYIQKVTLKTLSAIIMSSKGSDKKKKTKEGTSIISSNTFWILGCLDVTQIWCFSAFDSLTLSSRWEIPGRPGLRVFWQLSLTRPGAMPAVGFGAGGRLYPRAASCLLAPTAALSPWMYEQYELSERWCLYLAPPLASLENWSPTWADRHPLLLKRQKQSSYLITLIIWYTQTYTLL